MKGTGPLNGTGPPNSTGSSNSTGPSDSTGLTRRLLGAALLALLVVTVLPAAAFAAEDTGATEGAEAEPLPELEEVVTAEARSEGFVPENYVSPSWFQWLLYPTIIIGVIMVVALLFYYLARQPAFAEERRQKSRR